MNSTRPALLSVTDLQVAYAGPRRNFFMAGEPRQVVHGVSFSLHAGECIGIVGESGSGKTTVARSLLRLTPIQAGRIELDGHNIAELSETELRPLRSRIQMVFQDPLSALNPRLRVGQIVLQPLRSYGRLAGIPATQQRAQAAALLAMVALPEHMLDRYPIQLSGGQRQRVGIARALALQPDLIVADEIVSGLDVSNQARILALLRDLQKRLGLSLIFITHDLSVVRVLCDRVLVMHDGRVVESGPVAQIFSDPTTAITRRLLAAIPLPEEDPGWLEEKNHFELSDTAESNTRPDKEKLMKIQQAVALVTGANRGLGREIVLALLQAGVAKVYAASRQPAALADLVAANPGRIETISLDITNTEQLHAAVAQCSDVSLLINNAGVNKQSGLIAAGNTDNARAELETNYLGTLAMCQAFAPTLAANGGGAIVNVLSILAKITLPAMGSLCASKAAGLRMTEGVRAELAAQGTWVGALMSGAIDTEMSAGFDGPKSAPAEVAAALLAGIEAGSEEIYVGEMPDWINGALSQDPKSLEREFAKFLPA